MSHPRSLRLWALLAVAAAALVVIEPALAFDPQPDPPVAWWDAVLRLWRYVWR